jgi:predicted DNA-binding protein with PD1-like motif
MEHGDKIPEAIENFALENKINAAVVWMLGGAANEGKIVVGPEDGSAQRPVPMVTSLTGVSEAMGLGTIFTNAAQIPVLHMHASFGRGEQTKTGCTRAGIEVWQIGEVIIMELLDSTAHRSINPVNGFELLEV